MSTDNGVFFGRVFNLLQKRRVLNADQAVVANEVVITAQNQLNSHLNGKTIGPEDESVNNQSNTDQPEETIGPEHCDKSFNEKIEAMLIKFENVLVFFRYYKKAREDFSKNYVEWDKFQKEVVETLENIEKALETNAERGKKMRRVGSCLAGLAKITAWTFPPTAPAAAALSALGNLIALGGEVSEKCILKNKAGEIDKLMKGEDKSFTKMRWLSSGEEWQKKISSLVDPKIFEEMSQKVQTFKDEFSEVKDDEFGHRYEELLDDCMGVMARDSAFVKEHGEELAPVVMTFIFVVCLANDHNSILLACSSAAQKVIERSLASELNLGGVFMNLGALVCEGLLFFDAVPILNPWLESIKLTINVTLAISSFMETGQGNATPLIEAVGKAAEAIKAMSSVIKEIHDTTKSYKTSREVQEFKSFSIYNLPDDATSSDIKVAVKPFLPEGEWYRIKLLKIDLETVNEWHLKVTASHSQKLSEQTHIMIKGSMCEIKK